MANENIAKKLLEMKLDIEKREMVLNGLKKLFNRIRNECPHPNTSGHTNICDLCTPYTIKE